MKSWYLRSEKNCLVFPSLNGGSMYVAIHLVFVCVCVPPL